MMCGILKKTEETLNASWPSFSVKERSIRKMRINGSQQGMKANPRMSSDSVPTSKDLPCLCKVDHEGNIQVTTIVEVSKETTLQ